MNTQPVITIVTVTYNAGSLVERTLQSVFAQDYHAIEYVIVDGGSTDNTLQVITRHRERFAVVLTEPDNGIYDAMNKGLRLATGEYILFLNAGDELYDSQTLSHAISNAPGADVYYGNTAVVDEAGKVLGDRRLAPPENLNWKSLQFGMCVSHQSIIARRSLCSPYDLSFRISADIDWTIKLLRNAKKVVNVHAYISRFLHGGASAKRRRQGLKERWIILVRHYGLARTIFNHGLILLRFLWHRITRRSMT